MDDARTDERERVLIEALRGETFHPHRAPLGDDDYWTHCLDANSRYKLARFAIAALELSGFTVARLEQVGEAWTEANADGSQWLNVAQMAPLDYEGSRWSVYRKAAAPALPEEET